jgi:hypothetical protein
MKKSIIGVLAAAVGLVATSAAHGILTLNLTTSSGNVVAITDNGIGDTSPSVGAIVFTVATNAFNFTINVVQSNAPGTAELAKLETTVIAVPLGVPFGPPAETITLASSDDAFALPGTPGDLLTLISRVGGTMTQTVGGTVSFHSSATPNPVSTVPLTYTSTTPVDDSFSSGNSAPFFRTATPYTLSNTLQFTLVKGGSANISATTTVIPEPGALAALPVAGLALLRRRR